MHPPPVILGCVGRDNHPVRSHAELSVSQVSRLIAAGVKLAKRET